MADAVTVVARRDIGAGEEVTVDYALQTVQPVALLECPCRCGSAACRGTVTGDDWRLAEMRERYRGHFAPFINARIAAAELAGLFSSALRDAKIPTSADA